ncbi:MAG: PAS domain S-box protein, partial [Nitrospirota bacterium]|nr:PAS domain S-box protein [Nitrospirota bacterium]
LCEEKNRALRLVVSHNFSPEQAKQCSHVPYGECLCGISAEKGEVLISESSAEDIRHTKTYPDMQEHGHIFLPLKSRGRMLGMLSLYMPAGIKPADNEIALYKAIADVVSVAIDNAMNHRQVAILAQSLETSMDLVIITDMDGIILYINPHAKEYLGYTQEEIKNRHISIMEADGSAPGIWKEIYERTLAEGGWKGEITSIRKNGHCCPLLLSTSLVRYEHDSVIALVGFVRDITTIKQAEKDIRIKDWAIASAIDAIVLADLEANLTYVNPAFLKMWGYEHEQEVLGMHCTKLWQDPILSEEIMERLKSSGEWTGERAAARKDGSVLYVHLSASMVRDEGGRPICMMASLADITLRRQTEEENKALQSQLIQSQKLESIGRLAGGVAHDFNNILSVVLGYSELSLVELPENHPVTKNLTIIREAGERAAALTHQLLAFSRKQRLQLEIVQLNSVIENIIKMLTRIIGEDIVMELHMGSVKNILADSGQIGQIIMNLAINARDAMPNGGRLTIETADLIIDEPFAPELKDVKPGQYVLFSVADNGTGMSREVRERIFEPFFTTKELGKGTGLGLATVYGIVKQHNGHISVSSEPGKGTSFKIYLPAVEEEAKTPLQKEAEANLRGSETILVVDDEQAIRAMIIDTLKPLGYNLIEASCGEDAVKISDMTEGKIDLLLTDVIMLRMNGYEVADILKLKRPDIGIILMSGYTDETIAHPGISRPWAAFIQKPLTLKRLKSVVREVLDKKGDTD